MTLRLGVRAGGGSTVTLGATDVEVDVTVVTAESAEVDTAEVAFETVVEPPESVMVYVTV